MATSWREQAGGRTWLRRSEILEKQELSNEDRLLLDEFIRSQSREHESDHRSAQ